MYVCDIEMPMVRVDGWQQALGGGRPAAHVQMFPAGHNLVLHERESRHFGKRELLCSLRAMSVWVV